MPTIVAASAATTWSCAMPSARHSSRAASPNASRPTAVSSDTFAPSRAAATAWFEPFPPCPDENVPADTVSPASGARWTRIVSPTP